MQGLQDLVTTKQLNDCINSGYTNLRILDTSWFISQVNRNGREEYKEKHIPGALYFDIYECCDNESLYGLMLPSHATFEKYVGNLGISNQSHVVVYDNSANHGAFSSQRVWWMFRVFGHETVSILNGGFTKWCDEGLPTSKEIVPFEKEIYNSSFKEHLVKSFEEIEKNLIEKTFQVVDARGSGRFEGSAPEPRDGIKPGHIPGSFNIPYTSIIDQTRKEVKNAEDIIKMFEDVGIDLKEPVVATCGSGVTACCLAFAGHLIGKDIPVFDGAWTEWYLRSQPHQRECKE